MQTVLPLCFLRIGTCNNYRDRVTMKTEGSDKEQARCLDELGWSHREDSHQEGALEEVQLQYQVLGLYSLQSSTNAY